jgi:hypothetical protein
VRRSESGSGLIETILLGLLFFIPLLWGLTVLSELHKAALATSAAAREAGSDAARAASAAGASSAVERAVAQAFIDQGLDPTEAVIRWSGSPLERGGGVRVRVSLPVAVFRAPFIGKVAGPSIWIRAHHVARVDPFGSKE